MANDKPERRALRNWLRQHGVRRVVFEPTGRCPRELHQCLAADSAAERRKAAGRAKVEHPFLYVKRRFGYAKVRYRGLAKNRERLSLLFGLANLLIAERYAAA